MMSQVYRVADPWCAGEMVTTCARRKPSAHDAYYLETASACGAAFITLDSDLPKSAEKAGVK